MLRAGAESGLPPVPVRCSSAREPTTAAALPLAERLSAGVPRARRLAVSRPEVAQASGLVRSMGPGARAAGGPARAASSDWGVLASPVRWGIPLARPGHPRMVAYRRPSTTVLKSPLVAPG